ncbi:unnamed protein product [Dovyalis caffra]|uniref:Uncharacterized protein n=1 Tax=Dovyalis caffra TaxID=77055 RepID=A0AAV1RV32_9ROSI|nr:unnamed protein product [Dovyalis caffra]
MAKEVGKGERSALLGLEKKGLLHKRQFMTHTLPVSINSEQWMSLKMSAKQIVRLLTQPTWNFKGLCPNVKGRTSPETSSHQNVFHGNSEES